MSVKISGKYIGNKKTSFVHELSGTEIITAAPLDNQGDGSSFSPTDLTAASLAACMMTIIGIVSERDGFDISGTSVDVEKHMATEAPRRISQIVVNFKLPKHLTTEQRAHVEKAAYTCPVHKSLATEVNVPVTFNYVL